MELHLLRLPPMIYGSSPLIFWRISYIINKVGRQVTDWGKKFQCIHNKGFIHTTYEELYIKEKSSRKQQAKEGDMRLQNNIEMNSKLKKR